MPSVTAHQHQAPPRDVPAVYTCPMHPEVERQGPGDCPTCGMALEPKEAGPQDSAEQKEIRELSRKFWTGLVLGIPVVFLALKEMVPLFQPEFIPYSVSVRLQLVLATPVIF
ncbi:MAG: copper-transporting ATPase, partial [Candidatus Omnitrophica bacterium]|nr:copper-transporting ATPase [Candidatus Omnitrophota bacterium]